MTRSLRGIAALAAVVVLAARCDGGRPSDVRIDEATPVVLISIDTLRSDHLPLYGYDRVRTPAIDGLGHDGIVFERAYTHAPTTLAAHASLLTGMLPPDHGVRDNTGYRLDGASTTTLQRRLSARGYATGAFVSSFVMRAATGLADGFDVYDDDVEFFTDAGTGGLQRPGGATLGRALGWLSDVAGRPFFLFLHLYEPHTPYEPPEPHASAYASAYDGEIATADEIVGDLLDELRRRDLYDAALILLLSDHGEGLGDHGEQEHGLLLYRESIQVPLILKLPRSQRAGSRVATPVQLIDVAPTLLALVGDESDARLPGLSLLDLMATEREQRPIYAETLFPRVHFGWSELYSLVRGRHQYIEGPDPELYDLVDDPLQRANLLAGQPELARRLQTRLREHGRGFESPGRESEETLARLRALGYVGAAQDRSDGPRPDPKSRLGVVEALKDAHRIYARADYESAAQAFRGLVDQNPELLDAHEYLARSLERLGRDEEALAAYEAALGVSASATPLALAASSLLLEMGRLDEARSLAELGQAVDPPTAHGLLARVARRQGDLELAHREATAAVRLGDTRPGPMKILALVLVDQGRYEAALEWMERVQSDLAGRERKDERLERGVQFLFGKIFANLGDVPKAEAAFLREIERFPRDTRAYTHLAMLYGLIQRPREAAEALRRMLLNNGSPDAYAEAVRTFVALGQRPLAEQLLRRARELHPDSEALARIDPG